MSPHPAPEQCEGPPSSEGAILVLTTREYDFWTSMQEILPAIEGVWTGIGESERNIVRMVHVPLVDDILPTHGSPLARIVVTALTPGTLELATRLRLQMNEAAPMIIYIHGDATEGFHALGGHQAFRALVNILTQRDAFVVACEADAAAVRCSFPNADVCVVPFPLVDQFKVSRGNRDARHETSRLAYVGRVRRRRTCTPCSSRSGSCACRPRAASHARHLWRRGRCRQPAHGPHVPELRGLPAGSRRAVGHRAPGDVARVQSADWLFDNVHRAPHVFVSPTLHSDENFGSSVLASLVNGHQVVTTAWGGHLGFQEWFREQLVLVPVHRSTNGPVVHPVSLAEAVVRAATRTGTVLVEEATLDRARQEFSESFAIVRTLGVLSRPEAEPVPLERSPAQRHIDERRAFYGGGRRIYADYKDPVAQLYFAAYGMKEPLTFQEESSYFLAPWTSYADNVLHVDDPHRGPQRFRADPGAAEPFEVTACPSMNTYRLPKSLVMDLVTQGYAFPLPGTSFRGLATAVERHHG